MEARTDPVFIAIRLRRSRDRGFKRSWLSCGSTLHFALLCMIIDKKRLHTARIVQEHLVEVYCRVAEWLAYSPDLKAIED